MQKYISRPIYLNRIKPFIGQNLIKVLIGQRRVGKSYLLFQLMDVIRSSHPEAPIIYINKEFHEFEPLGDHKSLMKYLNEHIRAGERNYIFIDEVQDINGFEKALRSLQAKGEHDLYITGSNAFLLSGELATYLSGRYVEFKIFGLTYSEFLVFRQTTDHPDNFLNYLKFGGLPYLVNLELKDDLVYDYLRNIYAAILFKDVVARHNTRNAALLENLVRYLADNTGSLLSAKSISDFLKAQKVAVSPNIILNYLMHLEEAFFVLKVNRMELRGKKIFETGQKYYLEDMGLRHALLGYRSTDIGKILENIVYLHLRVAGYEVHIGKFQDKEIDFVCQRGSEKMYVQVTYLLSDEKTIQREFGNLELILDNYPKFVVSMDEHASGSRNGIEHVGIRDFLVRIVPQ
ncbi:MAG TPA: ATP-binding protein [Cyclobacteriaceae bacterium]|nr:ATP-binding protein [Cyclobacteriaceae bacterium]